MGLKLKPGPKANRMLSRKKTRELLMQLVCQMTILDDFDEKCKAKFIEEHGGGLEKNRPDMDYFDLLLSKVRENLDGIDASIEEASENWKIGRIAKVDLGILRLAVAEMKYMEGIPHKVSIDEAVILARKYGGEQSSKFVNGILGRIER